jgi:hypothetical protein
LFAPFGVISGAPPPVRREVACGGAVALNRHDHTNGRLGAALAVLRDDGRGEGAGSLATGGAMKVGVERFLRRLYDLKYLVGDKRTLAILVTLSDGPVRRVEILSTINSYPIGEEWSDNTLSCTIAS